MPSFYGLWITPWKGKFCSFRRELLQCILHLSYYASSSFPTFSYNIAMASKVAFHLSWLKYNCRMDVYLYFWRIFGYWPVRTWSVWGSYWENEDSLLLRQSFPTTGIIQWNATMIPVSKRSCRPNWVRAVQNLWRRLFRGRSHWPRVYNHEALHWVYVVSFPTTLICYPFVLFPFPPLSALAGTYQPELLTVFPFPPGCSSSYVYSTYHWCIFGFCFASNLSSALSLWFIFKAHTPDTKFALRPELISSIECLCSLLISITLITDLGFYLFINVSSYLLCIQNIKVINDESMI